MKDGIKWGTNKSGNTVPLCRTCECPGNEECGHKPVKGHGCELDETGQCYCCREKQGGQKKGQA